MGEIENAIANGKVDLFQIVTLFVDNYVTF